MSSNATPKIKAVLFDLDGTLIDSAPDLARAADALRIQRGLPSLPLERYRPMAGAGARGMLHVAFGITPDHRDFSVLKEEFFGNYEKGLLDSTYAFSGIDALLHTITQKGLLWGIVTNKSKRFTNPLVAQMPLLTGAAVVISGDTTAHTKPHPEPLLEAARQLAVAPTECIYVGDDQRDIQAAIAAQMAGYAACWGYMGEHDVRSWGAKALLQHPLDVLQHLPTDLS